MMTKFWSVIWFASTGTAVGYAMREGFAHFAEADGSRRVLGFLAVAVVTACATVGMLSIWRAVLKLPSAPRRHAAGARSH